MINRFRNVASVAVAGLAGLALVASCSAVNEPDPPVANGGTGGTGGTTSQGGGGEGGAYAQAGFADSSDGSLRYRGAPFAAEDYDGRFLQVDFIWTDAATRPEPFDLSVELAGSMDPLAQVFTNGAQPFARMGVKVQRLEPDVSYRVEATRTSDTVWATIVRSENGAVVLSGSVVEIGPSAGDSLLFVTPKTRPRIRLSSPSAAE